ncbi:hypothetical protein A0256_02520 [Mucilaginibacter sp. PAMC 26640]|nr:hypothetical protein A0256_02520 [Mucilaginibacter sp. PAMC 26640]
MTIAHRSEIPLSAIFRHQIDFADGFINAPFVGFSPSTAVSKGLLTAGIAESFLKVPGKTPESIAAVITGRALGIAGVAFTAYSAYKQNGYITIEDGAKLIIGVALMAWSVGWVTLGYAGLDI